ncbi:hypothetical protein [Desulfovulcanus sp.]
MATQPWLTDCPYKTCLKVETPVEEPENGFVVVYDKEKQVFVIAPPAASITLARVPNFDSGWLARSFSYDLKVMSLTHNLGTTEYIAKVFCKVIGGSGSAAAEYQTGDILEVQVNDIHGTFAAVGVHAIMRPNELILAHYCWMPAFDDNLSGYIEFSDIRVLCWKLV